MASSKQVNRILRLSSGTLKIVMSLSTSDSLLKYDPVGHDRRAAESPTLQRFSPNCLHHPYGEIGRRRRSDRFGTCSRRHRRVLFRATGDRVRTIGNNNNFAAGGGDFGGRGSTELGRMHLKRLGKCAGGQNLDSV